MVIFLRKLTYRYDCPPTFISRDPETDMPHPTDGSEVRVAPARKGQTRGTLQRVFRVGTPSETVTGRGTSDRDTKRQRKGEELHELPETKIIRVQDKVGVS